MFEDDTYSYKGWMTSDYFLKRAFGALLYQASAALIIYGILLGIIIILVVMVIAFTGITGTRL